MRIFAFPTLIVFTGMSLSISATPVGKALTTAGQDSAVNLIAAGVLVVPVIGEGAAIAIKGIWGGARTIQGVLEGYEADGARGAVFEGTLTALGQFLPGAAAKALGSFLPEFKAAGDVAKSILTQPASELQKALIDGAAGFLTDLPKNDPFISSPESQAAAMVAGLSGLAKAQNSSDGNDYTNPSGMHGPNGVSGDIPSLQVNIPKSTFSGLENVLNGSGGKGKKAGPNDPKALDNALGPLADQINSGSKTSTPTGTGNKGRTPPIAPVPFVGPDDVITVAGWRENGYQDVNGLRIPKYDDKVLHLRKSSYWKRLNEIAGFAHDNQGNLGDVAVKPLWQFDEGQDWHWSESSPEADRFINKISQWTKDFERASTRSTRH